MTPTLAKTLSRKTSLPAGPSPPARPRLPGRAAPTAQPRPRMPVRAGRAGGRCPELRRLWVRGALFIGSCDLVTSPKPSLDSVGRQESASWSEPPLTRSCGQRDWVSLVAESLLFPTKTATHGRLSGRCQHGPRARGPRAEPDRVLHRPGQAAGACRPRAWDRSRKRAARPAGGAVLRGRPPSAGTVPPAAACALDGPLLNQK